MKTKPHVFMANNGELVIAHPMCFLKDSSAVGGAEFAVALLGHDGYVIEHLEHPPWFMNLECEKFFEDLGEL